MPRSIEGDLPSIPARSVACAMADALRSLADRSPCAVWSALCAPGAAVRADGRRQEAIIDRAASLRGRSRTEFVREAAVRAAEEALVERTLIRMSPEAFAAFRSAIEAPATAVEEMVEIFERPAPWEPEATG